MTTLADPVEQHFRLDCVDWEFYQTLLDQLGDRHVFVTFNDGSIELMSPSWEHDKRGRRLGLLVSVLAEELNIPVEGGGSTTFKREDALAGLEPDECFYVGNFQRVTGKSEIDLSIDPPPDLAIEIEVSRRMIARMPIYAALKIPEIWRDDGEHVHVHVLGNDGSYREERKSISFPTMPIDQIDQFLDLAKTTDEMNWTRTGRNWVKQNLVGKT